VLGAIQGEALGLEKLGHELDVALGERHGDEQGDAVGLNAWSKMHSEQQTWSVLN
jgi:hypothetical protein